MEEVYADPYKFGFGKLAQKGIRDAWQLENDIIPCAVELEKNGLPIDRSEAQANLEKCQTIQLELLKEWQKLVPNLNYTQNKKLKEHLNVKYNLSIGSLNKSALADLSHLEEVKLLGKLKNWSEK